MDKENSGEEKEYFDEYKNCGHCGSKLDKRATFCYNCGKRQYKGPKNINKMIKNIIVVAAVLIIVFQLLNLIGVIETIDSISLGKKHARSPKEAIHNSFKAMDTNDIRLYINSIDYEGRYDNLDDYCKTNNIDINKFIEVGTMLLRQSDSNIDNELGDGWSKNLDIRQPKDIGTSTIVGVNVNMNGQDVLMHTKKVPKRGWFVYGEVGEYKEDFYRDIERILSYDEIYIKEEQRITNDNDKENIEFKEYYTEEEIDLDEYDVDDQYKPGMGEPSLVLIGEKKFYVSYPTYRSFNERYISEDTGGEYWTTFSRMYECEDEDLILKENLDLKKYRYEDIQGSYIYKIPIIYESWETVVYISDVTGYIYSEEGFGEDALEYVQEDVKKYKFQQNLNSDPNLKYLGEDKNNMPNDYLDKILAIEDLDDGWGTIENVNLGNIDLMIYTFDNEYFDTNQCKEIYYRIDSEVMGVTIGMTRKEIENILPKHLKYENSDNVEDLAYTLGEDSGDLICFYFDDVDSGSTGARAVNNSYFEPLQWFLESQYDF